jgi:hypothetical protein
LYQNREIVQQVIVDELHELGEPVMKTIVWHLNTNGIFLDSKEKIDIRLFYDELGKIVGNVADIAIESIYENLRSKAQFESLPPISKSGSLEPALNKIEQLMIPNGNSGGSVRGA